MAETKKATTKKKTHSKSNKKDVKVTFNEKPIRIKSAEECPLLMEITSSVTQRIDKLENFIDAELNPIHRIELEAERRECLKFLGYLKRLSTESAEDKLIKAIFKD